MSTGHCALIGNGSVGMTRSIASTHRPNPLPRLSSTCTDPPDFSYIGYSLEPQLQDTRFIPFEERPMRAYVLGKHQTFFYEDHAHVAWKRDTYKRALDEIRKDIPDFEFVGAFFDERGDDEKKKEGPLPLPEGIRNIYPLNATAFDDALSSARMLVGIGWPTASPSPYRALARGVPFLSPVS